MSNNDTKKILSGPFQSESNPELYYVQHQDGTQHVLSTDLLFAGTVTEVVVEEEQEAVDPDAALKAELAARLERMQNEEGLQTISMTVAP